jgi:hypothetical protein
MAALSPLQRYQQEQDQDLERIPGGGYTTGPVGVGTPTVGVGASTGSSNGGSSGSGASTAGDPTANGNVQQPGSSAPENPNGQQIPTNTQGLGAGLLTGQGVAGFAPAEYQEFGNIPTVGTDTYTSTGVDNNYLPGALAESDQEIAQGLAPQFAAQQMSQDDNLASRGIVNSGAATYLNDQLAGQQDAALAGAESPLVEEYAQFGNSNAQLNATAQNAAAAANAAAGNNSNNINAELYYGATSGNEQAYNDYLSGLLGDASSYGQNLENGFLGTYGTSGSPTIGNPTLNYSGNSTLGSGLAAGLSGLGSLAATNNQVSGQDTGLGTGGDAFGSGEDYSGSYYGVD